MPGRSPGLTVTAQDIPLSGTLTLPEDAIITALAADLARERKVSIQRVPRDQWKPVSCPEKIVILGSDHGGFALKQALLPLLDELKLEVRDVGVHSEQAVDYPDLALQVAEAVARGEGQRGIMIDGAGIGSAMAANKVPGIRAALCYDRPSARNSREHNDANVLTLGGRLLTPTQAADVVRTWLTTPFAGGRHSARIAKITEIERRYSK